MQYKLFKTTNSDLNYGLSGLATAPIGYLVLLFLPVYLEVVGINLSLTEQQVGWLAATDSVGLALAAFIFSIFIKQLNFRKVLLVGVVVTVVGNLLSALTHNFLILCFIRSITGLGEGVIVAVGISAIGMTKNPNRWFGYYTAAIVVVQAIGLALVPIIYAQLSLSGVFIAMALFYLIPLVVIKLLPHKSDDYKVAQGNETYPKKQPSKPLNLGLLSLLFFYMSIGGVWTYMSLMGTSADLTLSYVSQALAIAMIAGLLGALFFAFIGELGKHTGLLFFSLLLMALSLWALNQGLTEMRYLVSLCVFSFFWSIAGARLFAVISDVDHSGKYISAAQTVVGVGYILGPILASTLVNNAGYTDVIMMGTVLFGLSFIFILPLARIKTS
ncbi:Predicted arabinose efflux permease, MFS family [Colwellia chukchiensis]|uniref:Predicted arabinose efflux permease, MFS family n=1 Tax=Colwellia chukchiensis TaxID=641665 RepID=A0A1H7JP31_9GAMM|nr:MFS transporter [Colwellia chukchiensis]SEK76408.1 Predicted arabinose efflux permease, MFS family [Colwellia chukchiensis]